MSARPAARCLVDLSAQDRLRGGAPARTPRLRIVGCPPSGAAAGYWRFLVRADVHVLGVQYPGRESRFREPAAPSLGALAAEAAAAVAAAPWAFSDVPLVVLGHSMGAAVAAELGSALEHEHGVPVALLALSAKAAPAGPDNAGASEDSEGSGAVADGECSGASEASGDERLRAALDPDAPGADEVLVRWLRGLGGTPEAVLASPELLALQLPVLRADLRLSMAHDRLPAPVRTPLLLLRGAEDATVDAAAMDGWRALTSGPVEHREYPGGHHPLADARDRLLADLEACARPAGPGRAVRGGPTSGDGTTAGGPPAAERREQAPVSTVGTPRWDRPAPPRKAPDVQLVRALVPDLVPWALTVADAWLDPAELRRRDGFVHDADREAFLARRCLLRAVLAERLGSEPAAVPLGPAPGAAGLRGRPGVPGLHFSLASSGAHVLIATGPRELGVDVEQVPAHEHAEQMARVLHPAERRRIAWTRRSRRAAAVARVWARKESLLKAVGTGLARDPSLDRVGAGRRPAHPLPGWRILDLALGPTGEDVRAALTVRERGPAQRSTI